MRIGVIGGGSFGTALAKLLAEVDHDVVLWIHNPEVARAVAAQRENTTYLPGFDAAAERARHRVDGRGGGAARAAARGQPVARDARRS